MPPRTLAPDFHHLSTKSLDLPTPPVLHQQTLLHVADLDGDGRAEWIVGGRFSAPQLVGFRAAGDRDTPASGLAWSPFLIEASDDARIEAGGASFDLTGNGRLDFVAGEDYRGHRLWWWENPGPDADPARPWRRRLIFQGDQPQYHDQAFGDFDGDGRAELVFWNQYARTLWHVPVPDDPTREPWDCRAVYTDDRDGHAPEGLAVGDLDGDGVVELLGGGRWFKPQGPGRPWQSHPIDDAMPDPRVLCADFDGDGRLAVVMCSADHAGPLKLYRCDGEPARPADWHALTLLDHVDHGHTLRAADFTGSGRLDILCGEMRLDDKLDDDALPSTLWLLRNRGGGQFDLDPLAEGFGIHEGGVGDLTGDGRPDIVGKPYLWQSNRLDLWLNRSPR